MKCQITECENERVGEYVEYGYYGYHPFCIECLKKIYAEMGRRKCAEEKGLTLRWGASRLPVEIRDTQRKENSYAG